MILLIWRYFFPWALEICNKYNMYFTWFSFYIWFIFWISINKIKKKCSIKIKWFRKFCLKIINNLLFISDIHVQNFLYFCVHYILFYMIFIYVTFSETIRLDHTYIEYNLHINQTKIPKLQNPNTTSFSSFKIFFFFSFANSIIYYLIWFRTF